MCSSDLFHVDIAEVQTAEGKLFLFVAIDRTSKFAFVELHLGNINVEVAERVGFELLLDGLVALDLEEARNVMALQTAVQR